MPSRRFALAASLLSFFAIGCPDPATPDDAATTSDTSPDAGRCSVDSDCDDGLACNGDELCESGVCVAGTPLVCNDDVECTTDYCSEDLRRCVNRPTDADGDGIASIACVDARGEPFGTDCDDANAAVFPGAVEVCDVAGVDEDCDPTTTGSTDADGDGYENAACCNGTVCGDDCNDAVAAVHPGATEVCNYRDDDCDGTPDPASLLVAGFVDADGDGRGDSAMPRSACPGEGRFATLGEDCDDANAARSPTLLEVCDGVDNDCDDVVDDDPQSVPWYRDADGDGFGNPLDSRIQCSPPAGFVLLGTDCNDAVASVSPAQAERCDGIDDDCNGSADFVIAAGNLEDDDHDGVADAACTPAGLDCDDLDAASSSGATEVCDGRDNDCDGRFDEGALAYAYYPDTDHDGFGDSTGAIIASCAPIAGYSRVGGDCDDTSSDRYPGDVEGCNGVDDDCDRAIDENPASSECPVTARGQVQACAASRCTPVGCADGFDDCDGFASNGCEANLTSVATCGDCNANCDDGNLCTTDACTASGCTHVELDCSSWTAGCSVGACNPTTGACMRVPAADRTLCDDGSDCTSGDMCFGGACRGTAADCGCVGTPDASFCTGTICDWNGTCSSGTCGGSSATDCAPYQGGATTTFTATALGAAGGADFDARCAPGEVPIGFAALAADSPYGGRLTQLQLECATVTVSAGGIVLGSPTARPTTPIGTYSGTGSFMTTCPAGKVLTGIDFDASISLARIVPQCASIALDFSPPTTPLRYATTLGSSSAGPVLGSEGSLASSLDCPAGLAMTGLVGRAGDIPEAIGIACGAVEAPVLSSSPVGGAAGAGGIIDVCPTGELPIAITADPASAYYAGHVTHWSTQCGTLSVTSDGSGGWTTAISSTGTRLPTSGSYGSWSYTDAPVTSACPPNQAMVGIRGTGGAALGYLNQAIARCASIEVTGTPGAFSVSYGTITEGATIGTLVGAPFQYDCPAGTVGAGVRLRHGEITDGVSITCGAPIISP